MSATLTQVVSDPLSWALAGFGLAGMLLYAGALEQGDPARATALLWLAEVAVPSLVGVALLGDTVRPGRGLLAIGAVILCVVSGGLLTWWPGQRSVPVSAGR